MNWLKRHQRLILESVLVMGLTITVATVGRGVKTEEQVIVIESEPVPSVALSESLVPQLTEKQAALVKELEEALSQRALTEAARLLIGQEQQFIGLYDTTMKGRDYLCRDGVLYENIVGEGLVIQKPGTVFFGNFQDGSPQGEVLALQAINLEAPRYDYSLGNWNEGYMEGNGIIGYCYYEGTEGSEPWEIKKEGTFQKDLIEGAFLYTSTDRDGINYLWNMNALHGVTVLDDAWNYKEDLEAYQLLADGDNTNAYTINVSEKDSIRWMNLIPWAR